MITINIDKLIGILNVSSELSEKKVKEISEQVTNVLLDAIKQAEVEHIKASFVERNFKQEIVKEMQSLGISPKWGSGRNIVAFCFALESDNDSIRQARAFVEHNEDLLKLLTFDDWMKYKSKIIEL